MLDGDHLDTQLGACDFKLPQLHRVCGIHTVPRKDVLGEIESGEDNVPTAKVWAEANDVPLHVIASWCAHSRRWQARLDGISTVPALAHRSSGFVVARVAPSVAPTSVRVELNAGLRGSICTGHWPTPANSPRCCASSVDDSH